MTDTAPEIPVVPPPVIGATLVPLPPIDLPTLRAELAKPIGRLALFAEVAKHTPFVSFDATPEVAELQAFLANDRAMTAILAVVNEARADGVDTLPELLAWVKKEFAALLAWFPKKS